MELDAPSCSNPGHPHQKNKLDNAWMQFANVIDDCMSPVVSLAIVEAKLGGQLVQRTYSIVQSVFSSGTAKRNAEDILAVALEVQLFQYSVEVLFLRLLYAAHTIRERAPTRSLLQFIEFFAGAAGITQQLSMLGCVVCAFDLCIDSRHDITQGPGFKLYLLACCCTAPSAKAWLVWSHLMGD